MHPTHKRFVSRGVIALSTLVLLGLAACGGSGGGSGSGGGDGEETDNGSASGAVSLVAKEFEFSPTDISVEGSSFTVELVNEGAIEHDFSVEGTDVKVFAKASETATGEVELDPGTYTFFCSIAGHREGGMEGTLTVEG